MDRLSSDVIIFVLYQKVRRAGDVFRSAGVAHGDLRFGVGPGLVGVVAANGGGGDPSRRDRVDVDTVLDML